MAGVNFIMQATCLLLLLPKPIMYVTAGRQDSCLTPDHSSMYHLQASSMHTLLMASCWFNTVVLQMRIGSTSKTLQWDLITINPGGQRDTLSIQAFIPLGSSTGMGTLDATAHSNRSSNQAQVVLSKPGMPSPAELAMVGRLLHTANLTMDRGGAGYKNQDALQVGEQEGHGVVQSTGA